MSQGGFQWRDLVNTEVLTAVNIKNMVFQKRMISRFRRNMLPLS
jgi:hypothetical protein